MKEIICKTDGAIIMVDDEDFPILSRFPWYRGGVANHPMTFLYGKQGKGRPVYMHQIIMGGNVNTDHADLNVLNNQKSNLRAATVSQNGWNRGKNRLTCGGRTPTSNYKGVCQFKRRDGSVYYRVIIKTTEKHIKPEQFIRLGPFDTDIEAAKAYNVEIVKLRGKFAWVNPIPGEAA